MGLARRRTKRLESFISACILAILVIVGAGVLLKQSNYNMGRFGIETSVVSNFKIQDSELEIPLQLNSVVPSGFEMFSKTEFYNSENLYEKINGKAPLYTESGFEKLLTQRFAAKDDQNQLAELYIYDMGAAKNAFSVYSVQKRAGVENVTTFAFAYRTGNAMYLAHGKYYIELIGFSESPRLFEAMTELTQKIQTNLVIDSEVNITELALFPQENIVPGSIKLYLADAFGFDQLTDTFTAKFEIDGKTLTAFLSKCSHQQDAQKLAENYYNFLISNGGLAKPTINKTIKGKAVDFYDTIEIVSTAGPFVFGVHEAENQPSAEKLAIKLANRLSKAAKAANNDRAKQ